MRFPYEAETRVYKIDDSQTGVDEVAARWYSATDFDRMRQTLREDAAKARVYTDKDASFDGNDEVELRGLEWLVHLSTTSKRWRQFNTCEQGFVSQPRQEEKSTEAEA